MVVLILMFILALPLYGILIWGYLFPEDSLMWGKRWMYEEEPQISAAAVKYMKYSSLITIMLMSIFFVSSFIKLI